jgi:hypothetical protein
MRASTYSVPAVIPLTEMLVHDKINASLNGGVILAEPEAPDTLAVPLPVAVVPSVLRHVPDTVAVPEPLTPLHLR